LNDRIANWAIKLQIDRGYDVTEVVVHDERVTALDAQLIQHCGSAKLSGPPSSMVVSGR
jgi:hypothetical protein